MANGVRSRSGGNDNPGCAIVFGIGWTLFSLVFVFIGLSQFWKRQTSESWQRVPCTIERFEIKTDHTQDPPFVADVKFRYQWNGTKYISTKLWPERKGSNEYETLAKIREPILHAANKTVVEGLQTTCVVNPQKPEDASLCGTDASGHLTPLIFVIMGGLFAAIGVKFVIGAFRRKGKAPVHSDAANQASGNAIVLVFCSIFGLAGFAIFFGVAVPQVREYVAIQSWVETPAQVIWSRVVAVSGKSTTYKAEIFYRYTVQGREYHSTRDELMGGSSSGRKGKQAVVEANPPGKALICYVNPTKPWQAILKREVGWSALLILFPLPFMAFGIGGWWMALREKRKKEPAFLNRTNARQSHQRPTDQTFGISSGASAQIFRSGRSRISMLLIILIFAGIWNAVVSAAIFGTWESWRNGELHWLVVIFLIPFVVIGVLLIVGAVCSLAAFFSPRYELRTPHGILAPGRSASLAWRRKGGLGNPSRFALYLIGLEEVTRGSGKSRSTTKTVFHEALLHQADGPIIPQEGRTQITIPEDAMHSFEGSSNKVRWLLRVQARMAFLPRVDDEFEIQVRPLHREELP